MSELNDELGRKSCLGDSPHLEETKDSLEEKIEKIEEEIKESPIVIPKKRKKRTMTPEMLEKLAQARLKSIEVKKMNSITNNKARLLKKESQELKLKLLDKTEKELEELKTKLFKPEIIEEPIVEPKLLALVEPVVETEIIEEPVVEEPEIKSEVEVSSSSDEEIIIKKKDKKKKKNSLRWVEGASKKVKKIILVSPFEKRLQPKYGVVGDEDPYSSSSSENEILELTKKQLKKLIISPNDSDFEKTFPKSYARMNHLERKNASYVEEIDPFFGGRNLGNLSGKKVINRNCSDGFEVQRVKIQPTVIDMKPKNAMKRGANNLIDDNDPAYKSLFGKGLYD